MTDARVPANIVPAKLDPEGRKQSAGGRRILIYTDADGCVARVEAVFTPHSGQFDPPPHKPMDAFWFPGTNAVLYIAKDASPEYRAKKLAQWPAAVPVADGFDPWSTGPVENRRIDLPESVVKSEAA